MPTLGAPSAKGAPAARRERSLPPPGTSSSVHPADPHRRDLQVLRQALARELETINEYERLMEAADTAEVRSLLAHLRDEEKEHVAECMQYIRRLDAAQESYFQQDLGALLAGEGNRAAPPAPSGVLGLAPGGAPSLTVGSLKGRRG